MPIIKIVPQAEEVVIERLGKYHRTLSAGFHWMIPIIDRIASKIPLKEQLLDTRSSSVITKDNITIAMDAIVYFKILDSHKATYGISYLNTALENLTITNLRNIAGNKELDEILNSRVEINSSMLLNLDEAVANWGVDILRVEIQNILPPEDVRIAMERQMQAERNKRASILEAQAFKESAILEAQGAKEAKIINAEAQKEVLVREAEGKAQSLEIEANARKLYIETIKSSNIDDKVMTLEKLKSFEVASQNPANKIIVPSDLTNFTTQESLRADLWFDKDKTVK